MFSGSIVWKGIAYTALMIVAKVATGLVFYAECMIRRWQSKTRVGPLTEEEEIYLEKGLPHTEALLVGFAMVARGEIGFLIASLSQSSGTLMLQQRGAIAGDSGRANTGGGAGGSGREDLFLVIVWSVVLCTVVGPVVVGAIVRTQARRSPQV